VIDVIRVILLINALALGVISVHLVLQQGPRLDVGARWRFFGVVLFAIYVVTLEVRRLGEPVTADTLWIQPLVAAASLSFQVDILIGARTNWRIHR
jgi:hypothetical protein